MVRLIEARHHDPFSVLGRHDVGDRVVIRAFVPHTRRAFVETDAQPIQRIDNTDLFEFSANGARIPDYYRFLIEDGYGHRHFRHDPYSFAALVADSDLQRFNAESHTEAQEFLGANRREVLNIKGTLFAVWAPNAERASVVGDFNRWDSRYHPW